MNGSSKHVLVLAIAIRLVVLELPELLQKLKINVVKDFLSSKGYLVKLMADMKTYINIVIGLSSCFVVPELKLKADL